MLQTSHNNSACPAEHRRKPGSLRVGGGPLSPPPLAVCPQKAQPWLGPEHPCPRLGHREDSGERGAARGLQGPPSPQGYRELSPCHPLSPPRPSLQGGPPCYPLGIPERPPSYLYPGGELGRGGSSTVAPPCKHGSQRLLGRRWFLVSISPFPVVEAPPCDTAPGPGPLEGSSVGEAGGGNPTGTWPLNCPSPFAPALRRSLEPQAGASATDMR